MKSLSFGVAKRIIDRNIAIFLTRCYHTHSIQSRMHIFEKDPFPIIHNYSDIHNKYIQYTSLIEQNIREILVDLSLFSMLSKSGMHVKRWNKERVTYPVFSLKSFGHTNPIAFALKENGESIGYSYTFPEMERAKLDRLCNKYGIRRIRIIDWSDTDSLISSHPKIQHSYRQDIEDITLRAFFLKFFSQAIFEYYIENIKKAVNEAVNGIGYRIVPQTTQKNISSIKTSLYYELTNDIQNVEYFIFNSDGILPGQYITIEGKKAARDLQQIKERFLGLKLYQALFGGNNYARCFLTSEYLYEILREEKGYSIDYTSVTAGYFKSIELLLMKLVQSTFLHPHSEELFINADIKKAMNSVDKKDSIPKSGKVRFKKEYEQFFNTEMATLINLLVDNKRGWYVSGQTRNTIKEMLHNYRNYCRNGHFHKEILKSMDDVEGIRHNTIVCIYCLLGAYRITGNDAEDRTILNCIDDSYDRLYIVLANISRSFNYFLIQFHNMGIRKAYRLFHQENVKYDENGNIISKLQFSDIESFDFEHVKKIEENLSESPLFYISRDNCPQKMWYVNTFKGETIEIEW